MKKIIFILLFVFLFSSVAFADIEVLEKKEIIGTLNEEIYGYPRSIISIWCVDGYKYVLVRSGEGSINIEQMFQKVSSYDNFIPIKCK